MKKLYSFGKVTLTNMLQQSLHRKQLVGVKTIETSGEVSQSFQSSLLTKICLVVILIAGFSSVSTNEVVAQTLSVNASSYCPGSQVTVSVKSNKNGKTVFRIGVYNGNTSTATLLEELGSITTSNGTTQVDSIFKFTALSNGSPRYIGSIPGQGQNIDLFSSSFTVGLPETPVINVLNNQPTTIVYGGANPTFSVTPPTGLQVRWYSAATNGTLLSSSTTLTPTERNAGVYTYYAELYNSSGCASVSRTPVTLTINKKDLTITGVSAVSREYNGATTAALTGTATLNGVVAGENLTLSATGVTAAFGSKTVGTNKVVTVTGYTVSGTTAASYNLIQPAGLTATISAKTLTIASPIANGKVYDGTSAATISGTLTGVISPDVVTWNNVGTFATANAGNGIAVTSTGGLSGADKDNYTLTAPTGLTANITRRSLVVTAVGQNKVYDGTTSATVTLSSDKLGADDVVPAYTSAAFVDKNVGTRSINVSGISISGTSINNYTLSNTTATTSANITQKVLVVSATGQNKVYDGNTAAVVTLATDKLAADNVVPAYSSAVFAMKNVGTRSIAVGGISLSGTDAGNYSFNTTATASANITQRALVISATGQNKVYDGTTAATVTLSSNKVSADDVTLSYATATFVEKNIGTRAINVTGISITGADIANYTFNTTATASANITQKVLVISATAQEKVYDGTTSATVTLSTNKLANDVVTTAFTSASFATKVVAANKTVTVSGITIAGADAPNYSFNPTATTVSVITPRSLNVTATSQDKVYDGNNTAPVTLSTDKISGDVVTAVYATATFADKNVGVNKVVKVEEVRIEGADAGNYILSNIIAPPSAAITPKLITGTFTANDKAWDGTTNATVASRQLVGAVPGDVVSLTGGVAKFESSQVGTWPVTLTGYGMSGTDAGNYSLTSVAPTSAKITEQILPVSLISFEGKQKASAIDLSWTTAAEKDNDYFQIERSQDGKTFTSVGKVKGNGNSNVLRNYNFSDASAQAGVNYYRLKQVDFDGKFEYSKVIAVKAEAKAGVQASLEVYPNPTASKVYVTSSQVSGAAIVTVFHGNGRVVLQQNVQVEVGQPLSLDLTNFASGVYYLQVQTATGKVTSRVVKQ
ncbi:YDG domain-containing protein [Rufibacter roseolus]|uniref:YDG domain-containing protein n=1 Tax=Rufibacter roseolus TaxID=2817375 RepID=UPI001B3092A7|nr:YDG domain-containing protein [Rufibacter roseolus]